MSLSKKRKGEIAHEILKDYMRQKGLNSFKANEWNRDWGNLAKRTNASLKEIQEYALSLTRELFDDVINELAKQSDEN